MQQQTLIPAPGETREVRKAIWLGWRRRCPRCGNGPLLSGYLKVRGNCVVCGQAFHHHRADDGPAWLTILITGHLMAPALLGVYQAFRPEAWVMAVGFSALFTALSLYLLPRLKGVFVGFQWAKRMHGFGADDS